MSQKWKEEGQYEVEEGDSEEVGEDDSDKVEEDDSDKMEGDDSDKVEEDVSEEVEEDDSEEVEEGESGEEGVEEQFYRKAQRKRMSYKLVKDGDGLEKEAEEVNLEGKAEQEEGMDIRGTSKVGNMEVKMKHQIFEVVKDVEVLKRNIHKTVHYEKRVQNVMKVLNVKKVQNVNKIQSLKNVQHLKNVHVVKKVQNARKVHEVKKVQNVRKVNEVKKVQEKEVKSSVWAMGSCSPASLPARCGDCSEPLRLPGSGDS